VFHNVAEVIIHLLVRVRVSHSTHRSFAHVDVDMVIVIDDSPASHSSPNPKRASEGRKERSVPAGILEDDSSSPPRARVCNIKALVMQ
jgi:F420-dependent methylenetetrahydromethanopterin dehydrogenase